MPWAHFGLPTPGKDKGIGVWVKPWPTLLLGRCNNTFFYKLCLKMINHGSRSTWGPGPSGSRLQAKKCVTLQQKHWCVLHFKFYYVFTKTHGCRATPSHFGPHYPWFCVRAKSRKSRRDQVDFWEDTLQFNIINFHWKWLTMAPEAHGAQVLQDPDCRTKNMICPH